MPSLLGKLRRILGRMPVVGPAFHALYVQYRLRKFAGSESYWIERYAQGDNSGAGSYDRLAEFKAEIINSFVADHQVTSIIELGCGDGHQLLLAHYPQYLGFDVSPVALARCRELFKDDHTKLFRQMQDYKDEKADLALSLDVIYHLIEDNVYDAYMRTLFRASTRYVIIYSSNRSDQEEDLEVHLRHRMFTSWIGQHTHRWKLIQHIPNRYPSTEFFTAGSFADFYIFEKMGEAE